jgi:hypothetical protein
VRGVADQAEGVAESAGDAVYDAVHGPTFQAVEDGIKAAAEKTKAAADAKQSAMGQIASALSSSATSGMVSGFESDGVKGAVKGFMKGFGDGIKQQLMRGFQEGLSKKILKFLGGGIFGGLFADGGRPPMGKVSIVGERGPEAFVPDVPGTILPTEALRGGGLTVQGDIHFSPGPGQSGQQSFEEFAAYIEKRARSGQSSYFPRTNPVGS